MLSAEALDAYLELWARYVISDRRMIRGLWYPSETPEHRYARRGGGAHVSRITPAAQSPRHDVMQLADQVDSAMAKLMAHNARWYHAVRTHYVGSGTGAKPAHLYAGRRWLRSHFG